MSTLPLADPSLRPLFADWPDGSLKAEILSEVRAPRIPAHVIDRSSVSIEESQVPGTASHAGFGLVIYRPDLESSTGCIFYTHGGGFVLGSARGSDGQILPIVRGLGCVLVSIDYLLAPEAVFPTQIEQCYAGLAWVFEHAESLEIDVQKIGVMGDSAGGGLAAALALMARDRTAFMPAFQHLIYLMLDDRTCLRPHNPLTGEFIWTPDSNRFGWQSLLGGEPGREDVSRYAAPARAESLAGLPPTYIMCGALDLFLDENLVYAHRLLAAGVPTEAHVYPGAYHGFNLLPDAPIGQRANRDGLEALRRALA